MAAVTNAQLLEAIRKRDDVLNDIRKEFKLLNGTVRLHDKDIVRLQERVGTHSMNWGRIWNIFQTLILAVLTAKVAGVF